MSAASTSFHEAFLRGQSAYAHDQEEYHAVYALLERFRTEVSSAGAPHLFLRYGRATDPRRGAGGGTGAHDGSVWGVSDRTMGVGHPREHEICRYTFTQGSWPVFLEYSGVQIQCGTLAALDDALCEMLASVSIGRALAAVMRGDDPPPFRGFLSSRGVEVSSPHADR